MRFWFAAIALLCAACTATTTSEVVDSMAVATDTLVLEESYPEERDTSYTTTLDLESAFDEPQLNERIAYVYRREGLDVFVGIGGDMISHVDYRDKVHLIEPLINNTSADTMIMSGLKGHLLEIDLGGNPGWIFSGYLVNLPVPEETTTLIDYLAKHLQLTTSATREARECNCEGEYASEKYKFENGITVSDNNGYESYESNVTFSNKMTLQEAYLFSSYFFTRIATHVTEFPSRAYEEEKEGQVHIAATVENDQVVGIAVDTQEGCYEQESIQKVGDELIMSSNGGC